MYEIYIESIIELFNRMYSSIKTKAQRDELLVMLTLTIASDPNHPIGEELGKLVADQWVSRGGSLTQGFYSRLENKRLIEEAMAKAESEKALNNKHLKRFLIPFPKEELHRTIRYLFDVGLTREQISEALSSYPHEVDRIIDKYLYSKK